MKLQINIDKQYEEVEVHINANEYNAEVEQLIKQLKKSDKTILAGYRNNDIHMLKLDDIYSVYAEGSKVFFQTDEEEFESKLRIYELEEQLEGKFVRINKSTIVNVAKISSLQLGKLGSTLVYLENDTSIAISRTYMKALRTVLGIRRD